MNSKKRRQTSVPCYICLEPVQDQDDIVYCPVCGEQYHKRCWKKNSGKCKVYKCPGESYRFWLRVEPVFLSVLRINNSKLLGECPNCQGNVSPLDRYCNLCGGDINRPERQNTFKFFNFALFARKIRKIIYVFSFLTMLSVIFSTGGFLVSVAASARDSINEYATKNAPTLTLTHPPFTATTTVFTFTPSSTFTKTPSPTATNTLFPTSTNTPRPTFTYTPPPTATLTPRPTVVLTPRPVTLIAFVTWTSRTESAPVTISFNAENSLLEYEDGTREECYKLACEYKWVFPDDVIFDFPSASIVPFRFTRSGVFNISVTVCWHNICDNKIYSVTLK